MSQINNEHIIEQASVISQEMLASDIYIMWIKTDMANNAKAGQFIALYSKNGATLLNYYSSSASI